jgi:hypothetical protein
LRLGGHSALVVKVVMRLSVAGYLVNWKRIEVKH